MLDQPTMCSSITADCVHEGVLFFYLFIVICLSETKFKEKTGCTFSVVMVNVLDNNFTLSYYARLD